MAGDHPEDRELLAYVEEELDPPRARALGEHLRACAACEAAVRELEAARDALRAAPTLRLPPERRDRIVGGLPPLRARSRSGLGRIIGVVTALLVVAALAAVVATQEDGPRVGGRAEEAAQEAPPRTGRSEPSADAASEAELRGAVTSVEGPPARVAEFLRGRGYDARVVDGSVEVRTMRPRAVERLLHGRFARGNVLVYTR